MNGARSTTQVEPLSPLSNPTRANLRENMIREVWQEEKEKKPTFLWSYRLTHFMQEVSVIGIKYVFNTGFSPFRRFLWLTLILFGFGFMFFQLQERIRYFLKFDTTTRTRLIYKDKIRFPTVTICNENRVVLSKAKKMDPYTLTMIKLIWPVNPTDNTVIPITDQNRNFANNTLMDWRNAYQTLAQTKDEAVELCIFKGIACKETDLVTVSTSMGECFQFNSKATDYYATAAGNADPLVLILYTNQKEYIAANSPSAGFRILLHEKDAVPQIFQQGIKISPGVETVLATSLKVSKYLPKPYGNCKNDANYRQASCFHNCSSNYIAERCGCIDLDMTPKTKTPICAPINFPCTKSKLIDYFNKHEFRKCNCLPQCKIEHYQTSISASPISDFYIKDLIKTTPTLTESEVRSNTAIVLLYFSSMIVEEVTESAAYSWLALMSDVGGAFGLVLGATFLTLIELIDFLVVSTFEYCTVKSHEKRAKLALQ